MVIAACGVPDQHFNAPESGAVAIGMAPAGVVAFAEVHSEQLRAVRFSGA